MHSVYTTIAKIDWKEEAVVLAPGSRAGTLSGGDGPIPAFAAEPGDTTSVSLERSWLADAIGNELHDWAKPVLAAPSL
jgi:hypothetical protein